MTVTDTDAAVAPTITVTTPTVPTTQDAAVKPFAGVTVADSNLGGTATDTLTITLSGEGTTGTLSGSTALTNDGGGVYTLAAAAPATINSELAALLFTPAVGAPGSSTTTTLTLSDTSSAGPSATPATVTVTDTDAAVAPTITVTTPTVPTTRTPRLNRSPASPWPTAISADRHRYAHHHAQRRGDNRKVERQHRPHQRRRRRLHPGGGGARHHQQRTRCAGFHARRRRARLQHHHHLDAERHQLRRSQRHARTVTVTDTDAAVAPTITVTTPTVPTTQDAAVKPFAGVTVADSNLGGTATDTLTITLSGEGTTGTLSGSTALTNDGGGVYTLAAAAPATINSELAALLFTPAVGAPGSSTTTTLTLSDTSSAGPSATPATVTVTDTDAAVAPIITVTTPTVPTTQDAAVKPFAGVTVADSNLGGTATDTLTITLSGEGTTGTLSGSTALTNDGGGVYTLAAAAPATINSELAALLFTPAVGAPGSSTTTTLTLSDTSSAGPSATPATVTVTDTDAAVAPTITVTTPTVPTTQDAAVKPFAGVTVADSNLGGTATDTLTITLSGEGTTGTLSGSTALTNDGGGVYTLAAAAPATINSELAALLFTPAVGAPGSSTTTTLTLSDTSSAGPSATPATVTVTDTDAAVAPTITVTTPTVPTTQDAAVKPFAGVTVADSNLGGTATDTLTITLSGEGTTGTLSGSTALTNDGGGVYTLAAAAPATINSELAALLFTPAVGAPGSSTTTTLTLSDTSSAGPSATPATVTVTDTDAAVAPIITVTTPTVPTTQDAAVKPFAGVTVADSNLGGTATDTLTITLSGEGTTGTLSGSTALTNDGGGVYTLAAAAPATINSELAALLFTPAVGAPGSSTTTTLTLSDTSSAGPSATPATVTVTDTDAAVAPIITVTTPTVPTTQDAAVKPFAGVTVADSNLGGTATDTLTITLSGEGTTGTLSGSTALTNDGGGVYTLAAAAPATINSELAALLFTPAVGAPGSSTTTTLTLSDTSSAGPSATPATVTVTDTDAAVAPIITVTTPTVPTTQDAAVKPFAGVTVADSNLGGTATDTLTITLSGEGTTGTLSGSTALTNDGGGVYTLAAAAPATINSELAALLFTPAVGAPGSSTTTTLTLSDTSSAGPSATPATVTVTDTDAAVAPIITVTTPTVPTTQDAAVKPFAGVTVADSNLGGTATDTLTITLSGEGTTGTLSGSTALTNDGGGVYTLAAAAPATINSELAALLFTPAVGAPGSSTTTTLTLSDTSSAGPSATPATVTVTDTDAAVAPTITQGPETASVSAVQTVAQNLFSVSNSLGGTTYTWTIDGGTTPQPPNYNNFAIDELAVTRSGIDVFDDTFPFTSGVTDPPNGPSTFGSGPFPLDPTTELPITYLTSGTFTQLTPNGALMTAANAASLNRTGSDPFVGEQAFLNTTVPSSGRLLTTEVGLNYAESFTVAGTFALVVPQESLAEGYGIFLSDNLPNNFGTETVGLEVIETPGGPGVELTEQNFQTGTIQILGFTPLNPSLLNSANRIQLNFSYSAPADASLSAPQVEQVTASYQLLNNNSPLGSSQPVGLGTIFSSNENFTRAGFFGQAPAKSDSILQGVYGTLDLAQGGGWTYELNATGSQYQALDLGQTATDPFTVKVANSAGAASQTVTIDVTGIGAGTLASVAENTTNPAGESIAAIFTNNNVQNTTSSLTGVAISQNSGSTAGVWEYSTDNGTTWIDIPTSVSASSALVLATNDLIRFVPATNYSGSVPPLNVYGLDSSYAGEFTSGPTQIDVNVSTLAASDLVAPGAIAIDTSITPVTASTVEWINTNGGTWTDTANAGADWSTGSLPSSIDNVVIDLSGSGAYTVTIPNGASAAASSLTLSSGNATVLDEGTLTLAGTLNVDAGTFQLSGGGTLSDLSGLAMAGGGLELASENLTVGSFQQSGGTLSGTGTVTVTAAASFTSSWDAEIGSGETVLQGLSTINGYVALDGGRELQNQGTLTWVSSYFELGYNPYGTSIGGATLDNAAGATFLIESDQNIYANSGTTLFTNEGQLTKSVTTGTTTIEVAFDNTGTVDVETGTLALDDGGTSSALSAFTVASGATLAFVGGTFDFTGGGTLGGSGTLAVTGGTLNAGANDLTVGSFQQSGGTLSGTGTVTVTAAASFTSSWDAETGSGETVLQGLSTINGYVALDGGRELQNQGTLTWVSSYFELGYNPYGTSIGGATLDNAAGATFLIESDQNIYADSGTTLFTNEGQLTKSVTTGTTTIEVAFDNTGTVDVETGTLALDDGGTSALSAFTVASGATLAFVGGTFDLTGGGTLGSGTLAVTGGTVDISGGGTFGSGTLAVTGGTLNAGANDLTVGSFQQSGGTLSGTGTVTVTAAASFTSSWDAETGSGETVLQGLSTINGYVALDGGRELQNQGTLTWVSSYFELGYNPYGTSIGGATLDNAAGATFLIESDQNIYANSGTTLFTNEGQLTKSVTTGTTTIEVAFDNTGTVDVETGTLALDDGGTSSALSAFTVASGATLAFVGGTFDFTGGGTLGGSGTLAVTGGTLNAGANDLTVGSFQQSGGTLSGTGTVTVTAAASFTSSWDAETGSGETVLQGISTINGYVALDGGRELQNQGTLTWVSSYFELGYNPYGTSIGGATLDNAAGATFLIESDQNIYANSGTTLFTNEGQLTKSVTTGTTTIEVAFDNTGTVDVETGTLALDDGGTSALSAFTVASGATLAFVGGTFDFTGGGTLGSGTLAVTGGTVDISGGGTFGSGTLAVTGGTLNAGANDLTVGSFQQSGGTLSGTGTVTVTAAASFTSSWAETGSGETVLQGLSTINGYVALDGGRELQNQGTLTWVSSYFELGYNPYGTSIGGATLDNAAGATFLIESDQNIYANSGTTLFTNEGQLTKSVTTGTTTIEVAFDNTGTVDVETGTLALDDGGTSALSAFTVASGATLAFVGGTFDLTGGGTLGGSGTLAVTGGTVDISGAVTGTNSFTINGSAALEFNGSVAAGAIVTFVGPTGTLDLGQPSTFSGEIAGISGSGDALDLGGFNSTANDQFQTSSSYDSTTNTTLLTVTDTTDHASKSVTLVGNYTTSNGISWTAKSDGDGGADVVDPPVSGSSTDLSVNSFATVSGVNGTITFADAEFSKTQTSSFTPEITGTGHIGTFSLEAASGNNGDASVGWQFSLDNDQITFAPGQTVTQSYNVSITDPQNPAANINQIISVSMGGPGDDNFVFHPGIGADTIVNFNPKADTIELDHFANAQSVEQLASLITADAHGAATIELGHNDSITIPGISQSYLQAHLESLVRLH